MCFPRNVFRGCTTTRSATPSCCPARLSWNSRCTRGTASAATDSTAAVIRSAETALQLVPNELREASTALGARTSRTILTVVVPAALPGLVSGALLAIARAAGETAPLLFTIGVVNAANPDLFNGSNTALSTQIFKNASQPFDAPIQRAWGAALTLILLVFILTAIARLVARRYTLRQ